MNGTRGTFQMWPNKSIRKYTSKSTMKQHSTGNTEEGNRLMIWLKTMKKELECD